MSLLNHLAPTAMFVAIKRSKIQRKEIMKVYYLTGASQTAYPPLAQLFWPLALVFALCAFAIGPRAHAVSPPPDGGYPGGNTAEGSQALFSLTTGGDNTAVGALALLATRAAAKTPASAAARSLATQQAASTRPTVLAHSIQTQPAPVTRPIGFVALTEQHNR